MAFGLYIQYRIVYYVISLAFSSVSVLVSLLTHHYLSFPLYITGSDFHNGIIGFSFNSLMGQTLDEDSENRTAVLHLQRQENR